MYINSIILNNFRCYRRAETTFVHPDANLDLPKGALNNVTLLIGTNGSGKTSILKAVALAVLSPIIQNVGFRAYYLARRAGRIRSKAKPKPIQESSAPPTQGLLRQAWKPESGESSIDGSLALHSQDIGSGLAPENRREFDLSSALVIQRKHDYDIPVPVVHMLGRGAANIYGAYYSDTAPGYFLLGYGATRRAEQPRNVNSSSSKTRSPRYQRVAGLFEEDVTLTPLGVWLPRLAQAARTRRARRPYQVVIELLHKALPSTVRFAEQFLDLDPVFRHEGVELPFGALSDGYRGFIGLVGDILYNLYTCCPPGCPLTDLTGVVMIDDIDLHLHPKWQRVVVPQLARAFPRLQFILTTHSPLVAGSVHAANVRVIGKRRIHQFAERLNGLSVDQILSSPYFAYTKPRTNKAEKKLKELLEGPIDEGDAGPALAFLKSLTGEGPAGR